MTTTSITPEEISGSTSAPPLAQSPHRWPDVLGLLWVVVAGIGVLVPALLRGAYLGSYDYLLRAGVTARPGVGVYRTDDGDLSDAIIPWAHLAWVQVHQGHIPLWNGLNGLGMPLAFNWQSMPASLPSLIGYLAPLRYAYDVNVAVTVLISGIGAYLLARTLGIGILGSTYAATVFELSGTMIGWLGFPLAAVMAWFPWIMLFTVLIHRGRHRVRYIALLALALMFAIFGGQPEALVHEFVALGIFIAAWIAFAALSKSGRSGVARFIGDLALASVIGVALSAQLLLPSLELSALSTRRTPGTGLATGLPVHDLTYLITQGFDGLPIVGSVPIGSFGFYYSAGATYVGLLTVILAVLAVIAPKRSRTTLALAIMTISLVAIVSVPWVIAALSKIPVLGGVIWLRALMPMALGFAVLGGRGLDVLIHQRDSAPVRRRLGILLGIGGLVLAGMWIFMRMRFAHLIPFVPRSFEISVRSKSFVWPFIDLIIGFGIFVLFTWEARRSRTGGGAGDHRISTVNEANEANDPVAPDEPIDIEVPELAEERQGVRSRLRRVGLGRWVGLGLIACETFFLISAGSATISSSPQGPPMNAAVLEFKQTVGDATVAAGAPIACGKLGVLMNANIFYGIHEFGIYDPMIPTRYTSAWETSVHTPAGIHQYSWFCPLVTDASLARMWGVGYVIAPKGQAGPTGSVFVKNIGDELLYRIPGAGPATVTPLTATRALPPIEAPGRTVPVDQRQSSVWKMTTDEPTPVVLRLRLANVPGWHATVDGRDVPLIAYNGIMQELVVPAGRHQIAVSYWPRTIDIGLVMAATGALGLLGLALAERRRRRRPEAPISSSPEAPE